MSKAVKAAHGVVSVLLSGKNEYRGSFALLLHVEQEAETILARDYPDIPLTVMTPFAPLVSVSARCYAHNASRSSFIKTWLLGCKGTDVAPTARGRRTLRNTMALDDSRCSGCFLTVRCAHFLVALLVLCACACHQGLIAVHMLGKRKAKQSTLTLTTYFRDGRLLVMHLAIVRVWDRSVILEV